MIALSPATQDRITERERGQHGRLLQRARKLRLAYDRDYVSPGGMVVWNPSVRGRCEVVEPTGCSCREYRLFWSCPHYALFLDVVGELEPEPQAACLSCSERWPQRTLSAGVCVPCLHGGCD